MSILLETSDDFVPKTGVLLGLWLELCSGEAVEDLQIQGYCRACVLRERPVYKGVVVENETSWVFKEPGPSSDII